VGEYNLGGTPFPTRRSKEGRGQGKKTGGGSESKKSRDEQICGQQGKAGEYNLGGTPFPTCRSKGGKGPGEARRCGEQGKAGEYNLGGKGQGKQEEVVSTTRDICGRLLDKA
jgi:hypothetical protein